MHVCFVFDDIILEHQPLGATYISSVLKQHGHTVSSINLDDPGYMDTVLELKPQMLAYSVATSQSPRFQEVNSLIKREIPDVFTLYGGPHPSYFPQVLEQDKDLDAICIGEGEYPTLDLCNALDAGTDYHNIENIHTRMPDGEIKKNPNRPFLQKDALSTMPFPDRELMRPYQIWTSPIGFLMAGRGCPYDCTFCFNHVSRDLQDGKWTRQRTADSVIEEIRWLRDTYGIVYAAFQDDTFILNRRWLREFCPRYAKELKIPFICNIRADLCDEELADLLAEAGCVRVAMGIENGDDEIRKTILAKNMSTEQITRACDLLWDRNIKVVGQNMIGVPGETVETALSTIDINIRCRVHINTFSFFAPFPGTKLGEIATEQGFSGDLSEIPREFQDRLSDSLVLKDKEIIEGIGHNAHLFVSYPNLFKLVKFMVRTLPGNTAKVRFLDLMTHLKNYMMRINGGRLPRHWHQPRFVEERLAENMRFREETPICEHISTAPVSQPELQPTT